jgi:hypothetical protein
VVSVVVDNVIVDKVVLVVPDVVIEVEEDSVAEDSEVVDPVEDDSVDVVRASHVSSQRWYAVGPSSSKNSMLVPPRVKIQPPMPGSVRFCSLCG